MKPQNSDGTAHFAYFDHPSQLSFVWDGWSDHFEVSRGGYGEPVSDTIHVHPFALEDRATPAQHLEWFASVCQGYIKIRKEQSAP